jgi:hypothetical protein
LVLNSGGHELKSSDDHMIFFSGTCRNFKFQKHQNWSKFHVKLQKELKIFMMCTRRNFFRILKILKIGVERHFQVVLLFLMILKLKTCWTFASELPKVYQNG